MATIQEIPLDNQDVVEDIQDIQEIVEDIPEPLEIAAPKKRGRPPGAKNIPKVEVVPVEVKKKAVRKTPAQIPAPPAKIPKVKRVVEAYSSSDEDVAPVLDRRALAAEMIQMLSEQRHGKANARREHYASWFN